MDYGRQRDKVIVLSFEVMYLLSILRKVEKERADRKPLQHTPSYRAIHHPPFLRQQNVNAITIMS